MTAPDLQKRLRTFGLVAIAAGALDLAVHALAFLLSSVWQARYAADPAVVEPQRLQEALAPVAALMKGVAALIPIAAAALIAVGVALVRQRPWATKAAQAWSVAALVILASSVGVHMSMVRPRIVAAHEAAAKAGANENALRGYEAMEGAATRQAILRAPFPLALLLTLRRRSSGA
jgi:hypothetical protein